MVLLGFPAYWQPAATGIIIVAVIFGQYRKRKMGLIQ